MTDTTETTAAETTDATDATAAAETAATAGEATAATTGEAAAAPKKRWSHKFADWCVEEVVGVNAFIQVSVLRRLVNGLYIPLLPGSHPGKRDQKQKHHPEFHIYSWAISSPVH